MGSTETKDIRESTYKYVYFVNTLKAFVTIFRFKLYSLFTRSLDSVVFPMFLLNLRLAKGMNLESSTW